MLKGIFWDVFGKLSSQLVSFGMSVLLARLLSPQEFGLIGMIMVFISMSQMFLDMGFSSSLVQKKDVRSIHYSSVFFVNLGFGVILFLALFLSADLIAAFYEMPQLAPICRALSVLFVFDSLMIVQHAHFIREMDFKTPALVRVVATLGSGIIGVYLAYRGYGVWSLVFQSLVAAFVSMAGTWFRSPWRPNLQFKFKAIKELWGFGSKVFFTGVMDGVFSRLDIIIIGKLFSAATLGFYTRAQTFNSLIVHYTAGSLTKVFFPTISRIQHDRVAIRELFHDIITVISFLVFGMLGFLYLCAEDIFVLLFSEKWLPAVQYFKIFILGGYTFPLSAIMLTILSGMGKINKFFKLEILRIALLGLALLIGFNFGIMEFLYCMVVVHFFTLLINMYFVQNELDYPVSMQFKIVLKYFLVSAASLIAVILMNAYLDKEAVWHIVEAGTLFTGFYLILNHFFKLAALPFLYNRFLRK